MTINLSREYWGGVLAGTGMGLMVGQWLVTRVGIDPGAIWPFAFVAVGLGVLVAKSVNKDKTPAAPG